MQRRHFMKSLAGLGAAALGGRLAAAPAERANIVVIITDDMGYADVGFNGCRDIPTPHIDRMAAGGVRFSNGYVTHSFCSPSRAALMTGRYQQRFGHEMNPNFLPADTTVGLPLDQTTLADALGKAGYSSIMVGKWHLGAAPCFHPLQRGFTEMFGFLGGGHRYFPADWTTTEPKQHSDEYITKLMRNRDYVEETEYLTDALSREAAAFIERRKNEPFFLYLAYNAPHTPQQAPEERIAKFAHIADPKRRVYAAMLSIVDDGVGRVLDTLSRLKLDEKTLIFFLSDNGGPTPVNGSNNDPLRGGKGSVYEGGVRVPFVARWTGRFPTGAVFEAPVSSLDIFPTALRAAGVDPSAHANLDGLDLAPWVLGESQPPADRVLFWRQNGGGSYAVRQGNTKLVEATKGNQGLYDLKSDIGEKTDQAGSRPADLARLESLKQEWNSQLVAPKWEGLQRKAKGKAKAAPKAAAPAGDETE